MRITRLIAVLAVVAAVAAPVALAFGFTDGHNPPAGAVGTPYSFQLVADSGCPPYVFVLKSGSLPQGLSLSSSGVISGTPTGAGVASFWAEVRDTGCGPSATCPPAGISCSQPSQRPFSIEVTAKLTVTSPGQLAPAKVGSPYSVKLTADGGGSQTWSLAGGALPAGLALAADGTLSGTPTAATPQPVTFSVKVTDGTRSDTKNLTLDVVSPLAVTPPTLPGSEVGHELKQTTVVATGGRPAYQWSLVGAPTWVQIDPASGVLTGSPETPGAFPFQIAVKDVYGATATTNATVVVRAKLTAKTTRLPVGKAGRLYRAVLRTNGGVTPFVWRVTAGKFPVGIRLDRKTGVLSGKPRTKGVYPLTFTVTDSLQETSETSVMLNILPAKKPKKKK